MSSVLYFKTFIIAFITSIPNCMFHRDMTTKYVKNSQTCDDVFKKS
jgi:hypothetical protein